MIANLEHLQKHRVLVGDDHARRGDDATASPQERLRAELQEAQRRGDRELVRRLASELVSSR
ncbi:MAG: hypothetical protein R2939_20360 [Kofleriaceae bacterium]